MQQKLPTRLLSDPRSFIEITGFDTNGIYATLSEFVQLLSGSIAGIGCGILMALVPLQSFPPCGVVVRRKHSGDEVLPVVNTLAHSSYVSNLVLTGSSRR